MMILSRAQLPHMKISRRRCGSTWLCPTTILQGLLSCWSNQTRRAVVTRGRSRGIGVSPWQWAFPCCLWSVKLKETVDLWMCIGCISDVCLDDLSSLNANLILSNLFLHKSLLSRRPISRPWCGGDSSSICGMEPFPTGWSRQPWIVKSHHDRIMVQHGSTWFNMVRLVVWNIVYFSIYWEWRTQ